MTEMSFKERVAFETLKILFEERHEVRMSALDIARKSVEVAEILATVSNEWQEMKKVWQDWGTIIIASSFTAAMILLVALYLLNAGTVNRFFATVGQDKTTMQDVVYQANGVRVYYFEHKGDRCYMADDPQGGAGIFCK